MIRKMSKIHRLFEHIRDKIRLKTFLNSSDVSICTFNDKRYRPDFFVN